MDFDDDDGGDEVVDLTEDTAPQGEGEGEEEELGGEEGEEGETDIPLQPPGRGKARRAPRVPKPCSTWPTCARCAPLRPPCAAASSKWLP